MSICPNTLFDFSVRLITGEKLSLSIFRGRVVLVVNVASFCELSVREYRQLNDLVAKYGNRLKILAFPCNQFGNKENGTDEEIPTILHKVRPGKGFVPHFHLVSKVDVNGKHESPIFRFLKERLQIPSDDGTSFCPSADLISWSPIKRNDVAWNFEKFLVAPDGRPFKRYSHHFQSANIWKDISSLVDKFNVRVSDQELSMHFPSAVGGRILGVLDVPETDADMDPNRFAQQNVSPRSAARQRCVSAKLTRLPPTAAHEF